jgi:pimeloyl-ACP methyl ester carboxylesterase
MEEMTANTFAGYRGGAGEPLVLVHGGGGTWRQWRPVMPLLVGHHEVMAVNLTGHWGGPQLPPGIEASIDVLVDGVERDLDAAGWSTAHVAGTSLGSWVALELAKRRRARSCTALAPLGAWPTKGARLLALRYRLLHGGARLMARDPGRWTRRPRLRRALFWHHFARPDRMDPADTAHMIVGMANCTILPRFLEWVSEHGGPEDLDEVRCPVQLVFPERDLVLPRRRYGEPLVTGIPHAEVRDLPGVGHVATWDDPRLAADVILDFTSRHAEDADGPRAASALGASARPS